MITNNKLKMIVKLSAPSKKNTIIIAPIENKSNKLESIDGTYRHNDFPLLFIFSILLFFIYILSPYN